MKKIVVAILLIIVSFSVYWFASYQDSQNTSVKFAVGVLEVEPQSGTDKLEIKKVSFEKPGFIVIKETLNGRPGQIVEVGDYMLPGVYENVSIDLPRKIPGKGVSINEAGRPVTVDMVAIMYYDNGDEGFNPNDDDIAYVNGKIVAVSLSTGLNVSESAILPIAKDDKQASVIVIYTDNGFSPNEVTVSVGDAVRWINKSSRPMWVASNNHPEHTILPTFDQFTTSAVGESYTYTFEKSGTWRYHDHVNASREGVVRVVE